MKNNTPIRASPNPTLYKWVLAAVFLTVFWLPKASGQQVTLALSQEIEVPEGTTVRTTGPQSERINGRGFINSRHLRNKYVVSGKGALPYVFIIHKTLTVDSWQHQRVKQVVTITLEADTPEQTKALGSALKPELHLDPAKQVIINCSLNIDQFTLNNGWFRKDKNSITLTDGRTFTVKYLEIRNHLYVPATSPLLLDLDQTSITLGDHQGNIELRLKQGGFSAACLQRLTADVTDAEVRIDAIRKARLTLTNSQVTLAETEELSLNSSLSVLQIDSVGQLQIGETLSDDFTFGHVNSGLIRESIFSDIVIHRLQSALHFSGKGSTLSVLGVADSLREFKAFSQDGSVQFPLQGLPAASLHCGDVNRNSFQFPKKLPIPEAKGNSITYQWGAPNQATKISLSGQRCVFRLRPG